MKIRKGARRPDGTLWAQGPVRVPEHQNMPPKTWGTTKTWAARVAEWKARPAKERLANTSPRQRFDPHMPVVLKIPSIGEIRWSNGHGEWSRSYGYSSAKCHRMGYWIKQDTSYLTPKFIGDDIEQVKAFIESTIATKVSNLFSKREEATSRLKEFERSLGDQVLDLIIADGESDWMGRPTAVVEPS